MVNNDLSSLFIIQVTLTRATSCVDSGQIGINIANVPLPAIFSMVKNLD